MTRRGTYPTDHVLGVIDDPAAAATAAAALVAAGIPTADVTILRGDAGAEAIDGLGTAHGFFGKLLRTLQFTTMDQMPDFAVYEAAIRDGRAVVAVRVPDRDAMTLVRDVLAANGAHFLNFYARLYTEELSRWRGPEVDVPAYLRR